MSSEPRETLHLPKGLQPQPGDKNCAEAEGRDHKWQWKFDIAAGRTSETHAICVHCGKETYMKRSA